MKANDARPGRAPYWYETLIPKFYNHHAGVLMTWLGRIWVLWRKQ